MNIQKNSPFGSVDTVISKKNATFEKDIRKRYKRQKNNDRSRKNNW